MIFFSLVCSCFFFLRLTQRNVDLLSCQFGASEDSFTKFWWRTIQIKNIWYDNLLAVASLFSTLPKTAIFWGIPQKWFFFSVLFVLAFFLETHSKECRFALLVRFFWSGHPGKQQLQKGKKPRPSRFHKMFTNWQNTCT